MTPLKGQSKSPISYFTELSPSIIYRELERYHIHTLYAPLSCTTDSTNYFKLQDLRVIANDQALYMYVKGKALWENNIFTIPDDLASELTLENAVLPKADHYKTLGGKWFTDTERQWLEYWRRIINKCKDEYHCALAETAVMLVMDNFFTVKRFGQTSDWTPPALLGFYINHVNKSLLDNKESNEMWRTDPKELTEKVIADVMFLNPPTIKGYESFGPREHALESWLRGMSDYPLEKIPIKGSIGSRFTEKKDYMRSMKEFLDAAQHIPIWAFALSNRQPYTRLEFGELIGSMGRRTREFDLSIALEFFSRRAPDTIVIATT